YTYHHVLYGASKGCPQFFLRNHSGKRPTCKIHRFKEDVVKLTAYGGNTCTGGSAQDLLCGFSVQIVFHVGEEITFIVMEDDRSRGVHHEDVAGFAYRDACQELLHGVKGNIHSHNTSEEPVLISDRCGNGEDQRACSGVNVRGGKSGFLQGLCVSVPVSSSSIEA